MTPSPHHVSRRHLLQGGGVLTLIAALGPGFATVAHAAPSASADELAILRERWVDQLTGRDMIPAGDARFSTALRLLDEAVDTSLGLVAPDPGTRAAIFTDAALTADPAIVTTYKRIAQMATAWATPGSRHAAAPTLLQHILDGLADAHRLVYNADQAPFGNWWTWQIGAPRALADTMAIVFDHLEAEQVDAYTAAMRHFVPGPNPVPAKPSTGANRVDICQSLIISSIVAHDTAMLSEALNALSDVWQYVTSGDGFTLDGSFVQHSTMPYTGTYGVVLLGGLSKLFSLVGGSPLEIKDPTKSNLLDAVEGSFAPFVFNGHMMDAVRGRAISRTGERGVDNGLGTAEAILWLARSVDLDTATRWRHLVRGWLERTTYRDPLATPSLPRLALFTALLDSTTDPLPEPQGHTYFAAMDRSVYRGSSPAGAWALSLGMSSRRTAWYECGNGENNLGYHVGDGVTYLYASDNDHWDDEFWCTADLTRLPGTTVDATALPPKVEGEWGAKTPANEFTGGASLGDVGMVAQHMLAPGGTGLSARKAWLLLEDRVVALGSDIHTASGAAVTTTIEQRNLGTEGATISADATAVPSAGSVPLTAWGHIEGVAGYLLLDGSGQATRTLRSGSWSQVNKGGTTDTVQREYATFTLEHGSPTAATPATYAYALLPGASAEQTATAHASCDIAVLRNDAMGQAVQVGQATGVVLWQPGTAAGVTSSAPLVAVVRKTSPRYRVAFADPTQAASTMQVRLRGMGRRRVQTLDPADAHRVSARFARGEVLLTLDVAGLAGRSLVLQLAP